MKKLLVIVLAVLFSIPSLRAEERVFERIDVNDGFPNEYVLDICQDREGFMWFATMTGLYRYDGYEYRPVLDPETGKSMKDRVQKVFEAPDGKLWMQNFDGTIFRYDKESNSLTGKYPQDFGYEPKLMKSVYGHGRKGEILLAFEDIGLFICQGEQVRQYLFKDIPGCNPDLKPNAILQTENGKIWLCTNSGVLVIDPLTESTTVLHRKNGFRKALEYGDSVYLLSRRHILQVPAEKPDESRSLDAFQGRQTRLFDMALSSEGDLWVISEEGIRGFGQETGTSRMHPFQTSSTVVFMQMDSADNIWYLTSRADGVFRYDTAKDLLDFYPLDLSGSYAHSHRILYYIHEDSKGTIWIGTYADGVLEFDPQNYRMKRHLTHHGDDHSISSNGQLSIYEDRSAYLWFGTRKGGVNKLNLNLEPFHNLVPDAQAEDPFSNETNGFIIDREGRKIIPTFSNGLFIQERNGTVSRVELQLKDRKLAPTELWMFLAYQDREGGYWLSSKTNGLFKMQLEKRNGKYIGKLDLFDITDRNGNLIEIYSMVETDSGQLLMASYGGGLFAYDYNTGAMKAVSPFLPVEDRIMLMRCILKDSRGRYWISGLGGVSCMEFHPYGIRNVERFRQNSEISHRLQINDVNTVYEDSHGEFWFGTNGGGLAHWDGRQVENLDPDNSGLPSKIIYGIIEDSNGRLWISTDKGLCRHDRKTGTFKTYLQEDGLDASSFSEHRPFRTSDGLLYFGTTHGITWFDPESVSTEEFAPDILFTDFEVNNRPVGAVDRCPLEQDINFTDKVVLPSRSRDFTLTFSSNVYDNSKKHQYEYMLEGYDQTWKVSPDHTATYSNIPAGKYVLKVRNVDQDNLRELPIVIRRHPLLSTLAWIIYLLIAGLIAWAIYRNRVEYYRMKNSLIVEKRLTEFKLKFFTNISHELRTMITLIKAPLSKLSTMHENDPESRKLTDLMTRNTGLLMNLVNEILDFRKIQNNKMQLKVSSNQVISFFKVITDMFRMSTLNKNIEYKVTVKGEEREAWFDVEKVEKIMMNLLSNALKFTKEGGRIEVSLIVTEDSMHITVADNGIGFDTHDSRLLERFHRGKESYYLQGTGIGLALVREFVELHRGTLNYESKINVGSKFMVSIPINRSAYKEEEISKNDLWSVGTVADEVFENSIYPEPQPEMTRSGKGESILIVEDNRELRNFLVDNLSDTYRVQGAANGQEALDLIQADCPDMVISDVVMPVMDGLELLRKVRSTEDINHLLFVLLTAQTTIENKINGIGMGADDYIEKPFDFNYLKLRIANMLHQRKVMMDRFRTEEKQIAREEPAPVMDTAENAYLANIDQIILAHMEEQGFGVDELCREMNHSKATVVKKLKMMTGCSLNQYIKLVKLKAAADLLVEKDYTVYEACYAVGYNDVNHFRIQFKNLFNKTPSQYKQEACAGLAQQNKENTDNQ